MLHGIELILELEKLGYNLTKESEEIFYSSDFLINISEVELELRKVSGADLGFTITYTFSEVIEVLNMHPLFTPANVVDGSRYALDCMSTLHKGGELVLITHNPLILSDTWCHILGVGVYESTEMKWVITHSSLDTARFGPDFLWLVRVRK